MLDNGLVPGVETSPHCLERRHQALDGEIAEALFGCSTDELKIIDPKRRRLRLGNMERLHYEARWN
jgi:hypothetical protein